VNLSRDEFFADAALALPRPTVERPACGSRSTCQRTTLALAGGGSLGKPTDKRLTPKQAGVGVIDRDRLITPETLMFTDHRRGFRATRRGEQAIEAFQEADKLDALPRDVEGDDVVYRREAEKFRIYGRLLLEPLAPVAIAHGEAVSYDAVNLPDQFDAGGILDTLEKSPTTVAIGASGKRARAAQSIGVLEPALDAADSARASNSIEKMLCHQMTAAFFTAFRLLERSEDDTLPPGERVKYTNAAARMMDVYQNGCLSLLKLKTRGTQRVVVQHQQQVNVAEGGRAVVAGKLEARASRRVTRRKAR
jgi:hypothetical protein